MKTCLFTLSLLLVPISLCAQMEHDHPAPEKLGTVSFPTSCAPAVQKQFERGVVLLHSFTYNEAEKTFRQVAADDPKCAMAHWGVAMSFYHQLWEPVSPVNLQRGRDELATALKLDPNSREQQYIAALGAYYRAEEMTPANRAEKYREQMAMVAKENPSDPEAQIFYALSLLGTAVPQDKTHANQKQALAILEPLYKKFPQHPGLAHYIIHSCDSTEMAKEGLQAARDYSKIAPSAPHALHMPSHIFTRLGYWDDSIRSNLAARQAAHDQGDIVEELHAMDYLTYAYLQRGRFEDAEKVLGDLRGMRELRGSDFKVGYAGTAMPVRYVIERQQWSEAAKIEPIAGAPPHVEAIAYWARAMGLARGGNPKAADLEILKLQECLDAVKATGNAYWTTQTHVLLLEAQSWSKYAAGKAAEAASLLRSAADEEDAVDKLPVTPGPIVPAREQLGEMLLAMKQPKESLRAFEAALADAPNRRGALVGAAATSQQLGEKMKAEKYRTALR
ncbi:MAG: hypothetical protein WAO15_06885, partial [Mycobacterium sp.]